MSARIPHHFVRNGCESPENRLRRARHNETLIAEYYYDGKNRQIARNVGGAIRFSAWDNWELVEEYASGLNTTVSYLQGANGVVKSWGANGTFYYYQDKLGSTTHVANSSGALVESYRYDLYGTPTYYVPGDPNARSASSYGIVDLYAGERWIPDLRKLAEPLRGSVGAPTWAASLKAAT